MSFKNKVVIVTGGSSGIGAATAIAFSLEGAQVVIIGRNVAKLSAVAQKCRDPLVIRADISQDEDVRRIIEEVIDKFGQIDVLVNNAGYGPCIDSLVKGEIMRHYDAIMAINLRAAVYLTSLASPHLVKSKGNVINVSSIAGRSSLSTGTMIYNVSKAGLDHFTICAAAELGPLGVRVNAISPGPVETGRMENVGIPDGKEKFDYYKKNTLLNRVSRPEEIADLVLFLASRKAKSITGSNYVCDNGILIGLENKVVFNK